MVIVWNSFCYSMQQQYLHIKNKKAWLILQLCASQLERTQPNRHLSKLNQPKSKFQWGNTGHIALNILLFTVNKPNLGMYFKVWNMHYTIVRLPCISLNTVYRIVASTNTRYYSENQLFVLRSQYIRTENPLHKQSEKAKTCH